LWGDLAKQAFANPAGAALVILSCAALFVAAGIYGVKFVRTMRGKNGNGQAEDMAEFARDLRGLGPPKPPRQREPPFVIPQASEATALPVFLTRAEGDDLEKLFRTRTHDLANATHAALAKAELVNVRQDKHSRILMEVQSAFAEHRGETRVHLEAVKEKQDELCARLERVEQQQSESGALLKLVAQKLGVDAG